MSRFYTRTVLHTWYGYLSGTTAIQERRNGRSTYHRALPIEQARGNKVPVVSNTRPRPRLLRSGADSQRANGVARHLLCQCRTAGEVRRRSARENPNTRVEFNDRIALKLWSMVWCGSSGEPQLNDNARGWCDGYLNLIDARYLNLVAGK